MSADWTPPAEAVEAAVSALLESDAMTPNDEGTPTHYFVDAENDEYLVGIVLIAAYPAIVAEKDAEIERLWKSCDAYESDYDEALRKLAAVAALADEWMTPGAPFFWPGGAMKIRAVLADHAEES